MKKYLGLILAVLILAVPACKRKGDVLATFKDGNITRGQFYEWLEGRRLTLEPILKKKPQQQSKLQQMAIDRLTAIEAKKAGFDKKEDFTYYYDLVKRNQYANYLQKKLRDKSSFKAEIVKASIIKLLVKDYKIENNKRMQLSDADVQKATQEQVDKAKSIIKELSGGKSFDGLAKKYSDDFSKKTGGDIGWISKGMRGPEFSDAAFKLKEDEYSKEPVVIRNAVYIIKVDEHEEVTNDNIESIVDDKNQAQRLQRRLSVDYIQDFEKKLTEAKDVEKNLDRISGDPNTVIFKIAEKEFKIADLNKLIDFLHKMRQGNPGPNVKFDDKIKMNMVERIFREELIYREAVKQKIDQDEQFKKEWNAQHELLLSMTYKNNEILNDIKVTQQEVIDEYNQNKDRSYTRREKNGNQTINRVMPLAEVKERIEYMLINKKRSQKRRDWENELLKNYNFKIDEKKLEGDDK